MKIAITGHTVGIGKSIHDQLVAKGHRVIGFSRSQGWDISDSSARSRMVEQVQDCDVFVNNAHHEYSQCQLLSALHESWQGQKKTIINIGSSITMRWDTKNRNPQYRNEKLALDDACEFYWNKSAWPRIMLFKPCATNTPRMSHWTGPMESPDDIASFLILCLESPMRIQQVGISIDPADV
jgi:nucleoside-diphosphate-sugar epimerase